MVTVIESAYITCVICYALFVSWHYLYTADDIGGEYTQSVLPVDAYRLPETSNLKFEPCTDISTAANPIRSTVELIGKSEVTLGEIIHLRATMYDSEGQAKTVGGDQLRARMFNAHIGAYSSVPVMDHSNGTYSIQPEAVWVGNATLEVELVYPRELISGFCRLRDEWNYEDVRAVFESPGLYETTQCHPDYSQLKTNITYTGICNLSYWNHTMQWYCFEPMHENMSCNSWTMVKRNWQGYAVRLTTCEKELALRTHFIIGNEISVRIIAKTTGSTQEADMDIIPCTNQNQAKGYNKEPNGFFYNETWITRNCKERILEDIGKCLRNTVLFFWGDSTLGQWFNYIRDNILDAHCTMNRWAKAGWYNIKICYCKKYNTTMIWTPHNIPVDPIKIPEPKAFFSRPISFELDKVGHGTKVAAIFTLYLHVQSYPFKFYESLLIGIRKTIQQIIDKYPNASIFIKMPHTHRAGASKLFHRNDYIGYVYTNIINRIFSELRDKVVLLNNRDATNAIKNMNVHPAPNVVAGMCKYMLSYMCAL